MTSQNPTEYACEKPCKYCQVTGKCRRIAITMTNPFLAPSAFPATEERQPAGIWYPNREKDIPLMCGCLIPWPIVQAFGQHDGKPIHGQILCSKHGWQPKLTQKDIDRAKKAAGKHRQSQQTTGQTDFGDIPPF